MPADAGVGRLQIAGHGTYWRHRYEENWEELVTYTETVGEGENARQETRTRWESRSDVQDHSDTDLLDFHRAHPRRTHARRGQQPSCGAPVRAVPPAVRNAKA